MLRDRSGERGSYHREAPWQHGVWQRSGGGYLAAAVEEIRQTKQIDPFKETLVIQVVHYLVSTGNIVSTSGGSRYCTLFL